MALFSASLLSICLDFLTIDFQPWMFLPYSPLKRPGYTFCRNIANIIISLDLVIPIGIVDLVS